MSEPPAGVAAAVLVPETAETSEIRLRLGADPDDGCPYRHLVATWLTRVPAAGPQVLLGTPRTGYTRLVPAATVVRRCPVTGTVGYQHRARLTRLRPGTTYLLRAMSDGAAPVTGTFRVPVDDPPGPAAVRIQLAR